MLNSVNYWVSTNTIFAAITFTFKAEVRTWVNLRTKAKKVHKA